MKYFSLFLFLLFAGFGHPFDYDMHVYTIEGNNGDTMFTFHGMGGNFTIADTIKQQSRLEDTLISFNFPDYAMRFETFDRYKCSYGTINELLPALWLLKINVDKGLKEINLYGYSAGGGAIINLLAVLNTSTYDSELEKIGIKENDKEKILEAIENGFIILDTPLKSIEEIIAFRGSSPELDAIAENYKKNGMEPILSLEKLEGLNLKIVVYFQNPDTILSNRDDELFIDKLKKINNGPTYSLISSGYGHWQPHPDLWEYYFQLKNSFE